jgi:uncharacterized lipoprotein YmbA
MKERRLIRDMIIILGAAILLVSGCAGAMESPPSRFYMLSAVQETSAAETVTKDFSDVRIGLGSINFPAYLDRQQIVSRISPSEVRLAEFDRWAEPLIGNFTEVFKENLAVLLHTEFIIMHPWTRTANIEFRIVIDVSRFDAQLGADAALIARWAIFRESDGELLLIQKSVLTAPTDSSDIKAMVKALSRTLADFSREVAVAIQDIYQKEHGK